MNRAEEAKKVCRYIWHLYLEERDYESIFTYVDSATTIIGTGAHEICHNMQEWIKWHRKQSNGMVLSQSPMNGIRYMQLMKPPIL